MSTGSYDFQNFFKPQRVKDSTKICMNNQTKKNLNQGQGCGTACRNHNLKNNRWKLDSGMVGIVDARREDGGEAKRWTPGRWDAGRQDGGDGECWTIGGIVEVGDDGWRFERLWC
ncbi:DUF397 domain-containing protein [Sesbania bispinosa]|nr:DUF397 domain-containing protein [Sesbania bispinosa]